MPLSMPYHLEVGHALRALERVLNHPDPAIRRSIRSKALVDLGSGVPLEQCVARLRSNYLGLVPSPTTDPVIQLNAERLAQLVSDLPVWFNTAVPGGGDRWYDSTLVDVNPDAPAAGWRFYRGRAEEILRKTLQFALESGSVLTPGATSIKSSTPAWPVVLMWKCSQPWLEGWVQWRTFNDGRTVIVTICTPGDGTHIAMKPTVTYLDTGTVPTSAKNDGFTTAPSSSTLDEMVVITEDSHLLDASVGSSSSSTAPVNVAFGPAAVGAPLPWFGGKFYATSSSKVVKVGPATWDGGV